MNFIKPERKIRRLRKPVFRKIRREFRTLCHLLYQENLLSLREEHSSNNGGRNDALILRKQEELNLSYNLQPISCFLW